jgi:diguanylate cyclase (GGDEF)-like protein
MSDAGVLTAVVGDDDYATRTQLAGALMRHGLKVETFEDGQQVLDRVTRGGVDLLIMDVVMPRMGGLEACRLVKGMTRDSFLPVLLVTGKSDVRSRVEGLRTGADDYVPKPFDEEELMARVEALLRIKQLHDHVNRARRRLEDLTVHDELTGLYSYRYLQKRIGEEFKRAERYHDPLGCVIVDIDNLAKANEVGGRELGDTILKGVASIVERSAREVDVAFRFGGDEFLLLLPSTHFAGSVTVAERIWRGVHERPFLANLSRRLLIGVSIGVALYPSRDVRKKDSLLRSADKALARAKADGGNRICVFQQEGYVHTPVAGPSIFEGNSGNSPNEYSTARAPAGEERGNLDSATQLTENDVSRTRGPV